jgi:hypothetical protein
MAWPGRRVLGAGRDGYAAWAWVAARPDGQGAIGRHGVLAGGRLGVASTYDFLVRGGTASGAVLDDVSGVGACRGRARLLAAHVEEAGVKREAGWDRAAGKKGGEWRRTSWA